MASRMWIGNIDRCWEVMTEVWSRRDSALKAREAMNQRQRPGMGQAMIHSESSKRKFEEELAYDDMFSFSDMLNSTGGGPIIKKSRIGGAMVMGMPMGSVMGRETGKRRSVAEPITEEIDPELTVRGRLHWVGVMKDWGWEVLLG